MIIQSVLNQVFTFNILNKQITFQKSITKIWTNISLADCLLCLENMWNDNCFDNCS